MTETTHEPETKIWSCKIGEADRARLPAGADARAALAEGGE